MTERDPGKRHPKEQQESTRSATPEHERRIPFSEVTIAAWTGELSGEHLYDPNRSTSRGSTSGMYSLDRAVADGGYVIILSR